MIKAALLTKKNNNLFLFCGRTSPCKSVCPGTYFEHKYGLKPRDILLPLLPKN